jgi:hypothetical protein
MRKYALAAALLAVVGLAVPGPACRAQGPGARDRKGDRIAATCKDRVPSVPNIFHMGERLACLDVRLSLYAGATGRPAKARGPVRVELYREPATPGGLPSLLETWQLDTRSLQKYRDPNVRGPAYRLLLPFGGDNGPPYNRPVRLRVRYEPRAGETLSAESGPLTLRPEGG